MGARYLNERQSRKLTAAAAKHAKPGKHYDLNGLFLKVEPGGSRRWIQRIVIHGKRCDIGLGAYPLVSLVEARQRAFDNRKLARDGGDPLALKRKEGMPTFQDAATTVIEMYAANWKDGGKSEKQWRASLLAYAMPLLGSKRVDAITTSDVMAVLLPIWNTKRETARRVRQRIGRVMLWAIAEGYRQDNPAGEAIGAALPKNGTQRQHQKALSYLEVTVALRTVWGSDAFEPTKLAFEFLVLTAARSGEVRKARWTEIDRKAAIWNVPAEHMKGDREHRVPLSARALEILAEAEKWSSGSDLIFASATGRVMSDSTLSKLLRENGVKAVPHGFRSSFRDWASERTNTPRAVMEAALAHANRNKVEAAYARSDLFEKRRKLMETWAAFISQKHGAQVVTING